MSSRAEPAFCALRSSRRPPGPRPGRNPGRDRNGENERDAIVNTTTDDVERNASEAADAGGQPGDAAGGVSGYVTRLRRSPLAMKVGVGLAATAGAAVLVALQHRSSSGSGAF